MATITAAATIAGVVEETRNRVLNILGEPMPGESKKVTERRDAAKVALRLFEELLLETYCADADTLVRDVALPAPTTRRIPASWYGDRPTVVLR